MGGIDWRGMSCAREMGCKTLSPTQMLTYGTLHVRGRREGRNIEKRMKGK